MNQGMLFVLFYGVYVLMMEIIRSMVFYFDMYLGPENLYVATHIAWMAEGLRVNSPWLKSCRNPGPIIMCKGTERVNELGESINQTN